MYTEQGFAQKVAALGGEAYIVGGWVRDRLMDRPAHDKDYVVCGLTAETVQNEFGASRVGRDFPVYLLSIDGNMCEVALARTERKSGHGYHGFVAEFSPETTIEDDLFRRDTTMNSLALRLSDGALIDPFGGEADIKAGVIRATSGHFRDDPVRSLRAARQAAQLGFAIEPGTIELMRQCAAELAAEPTERVFAEMRKALSSPQPQAFFTALRKADILAATFPEVAALCGVQQPPAYHHGLDAFEHTMEVLKRTSELSGREETRFAALVHDLGKGLTPCELWPHHYDHPQQGLEALKKLDERMTLPKPWYKFARFVIARHMDIPRTKKLGTIVSVLLQMQRGGFAPSEVAAVIAADHDSVPTWLKHGDQLIAFLTERRKAVEFPPSLPLPERETWLRMKLANALADKLTEING